MLNYQLHNDIKLHDQFKPGGLWQEIILALWGTSSFKRVM
jgi:hypothetical protein